MAVPAKNVEVYNWLKAEAEAIGLKFEATEEEDCVWYRFSWKHPIGKAIGLFSTPRIRDAQNYLNGYADAQWVAKKES